MRCLNTALLLAAIIAIALPSNAPAVAIAWSPVGNPGNVSDGGYGAVPYNYSIGTYDVTVNQYVDFLNAKDATGSNAFDLYNSGMSNATNGGVTFAPGNSIGAKYGVISGTAMHPMGYVTWYNAIRFANWINNGQGNGSTETGSYTLGPLFSDGRPIDGNAIARNAGASVVIPNMDEWIKAADYNPITLSYFTYPTSSNVPPIPSGPSALPNHANYLNAVGNLTDVGAYPGTMSPYGAFDMGGNIFQYTENHASSFDRRTVGCSYNYPVMPQDPAYITADPVFHVPTQGFRLAMIPEPSSLILAAFGFASLAAWCWRRRFSQRAQVT